MRRLETCGGGSEGFGGTVTRLTKKCTKKCTKTCFPQAMLPSKFWSGCLGIGLNIHVQSLGKNPREGSTGVCCCAYGVTSETPTALLVRALYLQCDVIVNIGVLPSFLFLLVFESALPYIAHPLTAVCCTGNSNTRRYYSTKSS